MTRNTISDRISVLAVDIDGQLKEKTVTEEFVQLVPMKQMTKTEDILTSLVGAFDNVGVDRACAVSVSTDGAPSMTAKKAGVAANLKDKLHTANIALGIWTFHCFIHKETFCCNSLKMDHVMEVAVKAVNLICAWGLSHCQHDNLLNDEGVSHGLPYHTEVRWPSQGIVLKQFFYFWWEIVSFIKIKLKHTVQLQSLEWVHDLVFAVDVTDYLNNMNIMLQGCSNFVTQYYGNARAFKSNLALWEIQLSSNNSAHFPCLSDPCSAGSAGKSNILHVSSIL